MAPVSFGWFRPVSGDDIVPEPGRNVVGAEFIGRSPQSDLFDKFGFKLHRAKSVDLAIDIVVAFDKADILDLGADLKRLRRTLDLQILDDRNRIAVNKHIAIGILVFGLIAT